MVIETHQELGATREVTLKKIIDKFKFDETVALDKLKIYWK